MASSTLIDWLGVVMLFLFGITMLIQGHFIFHGKHGYKHSEREKQKMSKTRKQVEDLLKTKWTLTKRESSIKDSESASNNSEWNIYLRNLVLYMRMTMRKINTFTLNITVAILDFLYQGRHFQRFWVLEEIARAPYFAFLSVLHLRESLGLRGQWHIYLMKQHFENR